MTLLLSQVCPDLRGSTVYMYIDVVNATLFLIFSPYVYRNPNCPVNLSNQLYEAQGYTYPDSPHQRSWRTLAAMKEGHQILCVHIHVYTCTCTCTLESRVCIHCSLCETVHIITKFASMFIVHVYTYMYM